jgi:hypothetical protein
MAKRLDIDLTMGYLFRPTTPQGGIMNAAFSSSTAEARLKVYLKEWDMMMVKPCMGLELVAQSRWLCQAQNFQK